jgi:hypothetical protein
MTKLVAHRGLLARLLFGRAGSVLCEDTDGLLVTGGDKGRLIAVPEMMQPAHVASGLFWSRLVIRTTTETLSYGGFRKVALFPLAASLNVKLKLYAESRLKSECTDLQSVAEEIRKFLDQQRYARDSRRRQLIDLAPRRQSRLKNKFSGVYSRVLLRGRLLTPYRDSFRTLKSWFARPTHRLLITKYWFLSNSSTPLKKTHLPLRSVVPVSLMRTITWCLPVRALARPAP